jgi:hypothetical protein
VVDVCHVLRGLRLKHCNARWNISGNSHCNINFIAVVYRLITVELKREILISTTKRTPQYLKVTQCLWPFPNALCTRKNVTRLSTGWNIVQAKCNVHLRFAVGVVVRLAKSVTSVRALIQIFWVPVIGIATSLLGGQPRIRRSIPGRGRYFSILLSVLTGCRAHPAS